MFRISYISESGEILHKAGFKSDKEAYEWIDAHKESVPLKLLIWSEAQQCFRPLETFYKVKA